MKKILILILCILLFAAPVSAMEFSAPTVSGEAYTYMPEKSSSFGEDLWYIVKRALTQLTPSISDAIRICVSVFIIVMLISLLKGMPGMPSNAVDLAGTIAVSTTLLLPSNALITLGVQTVESLSEYGKLLLPVMTAAMAAEGGTASSAALYTGTVVFDAILITGITKFLVPVLYAFLALSIAKAAIDEQILGDLQAFFKWLVTWLLKTSIYLITGYLGITGVVSGSVDAAALKATKLAVSSAVPVVGKIISDASETILVSAGVMKNAAGTYGLLAILATWIGPFLKIGIQYLMLKLTGAICAVFGCKRIVSLMESFCATMGLLVAATGTVCLLILISTVCFMKGVG